MVTPYSPVYLGQSDDYTLTQSDIGSWVTIGFDDPLGVYAQEQLTLTCWWVCEPC